MPGKHWHRALTVEEQRQGIFVGEVRAIVESIENFLPDLRGHVLQFMEDNQGAMYATRRLVSKNPDALALLRRLWVLLGANRIRLQDVDWVASEHNPADAAHSGLLECPMTTRLTKVVDGAYAVHANASSPCAEPILTYHECFEAARKVFRPYVSVSNASGADARRPVGCSAALRPSSASVSVFFNEMASPPTACSVAHLHRVDHVGAGARGEASTSAGRRGRRAAMVG